MKYSNGMKFKAAIAAVVLVVTCAGAAVALNIPGFGGKETVKATNGAVTIPVAKVNNGKAHFYKYASGGKEISFFVVKGTDSAFHVALDACDACFREKKGYVADGDAMLCRNCNKRFLINKIGQANTGGCNPAFLNFQNDGKSIKIKEADLKAGAKYF